MFCGKCGARNDDGGKFCASCGAPLAETVVNVVQNDGNIGQEQSPEGYPSEQPAPEASGQNPQPQPGRTQELSGQEGYAPGSQMQGNYGQAGYQTDAGYAQDFQAQGNYGPAPGYQDGPGQYGYQNGGQDYQQPEPEKQSFIDKIGKKKFFTLVGAAAVLIVVIIVVIALVAGRKKTLDVADYVTVEVTGANGYGVLEVSGLYEWEDDAYDIIYKKYKSTSEKFYLAVFSMYDISVSYEADPEEGLSNGDIVTITFEIDDEDSQDLPFKLKATTIKYEVEGLTEVQTIDLFEYLEVEYSGFAPYAKAYVDGDCEYTYVYYYIEGDNDNLSNGDTITVYADYDADDLLEAGYVAESDYTEIEVSGLDTYVFSLDDIPSSAIEKMKSQAEDEFSADVASSWNADYRTAENMTYLGCYFIYPKSDRISYSFVNRIYLVYEVNAWNEDDGDFTYYITYSYQDIVILADGTCSVDLDDCSSTSNYFYMSSLWYSYYGYKTLDSAFSECVTSYVDDYSYESTVETETDTDAGQETEESETDETESEDEAEAEE